MTGSATAEQRPPHSSRIRLRAAIVHDWFQGYHGSERVVETMRAGLFAPELPPDIFTFHAAREVIPDELAAAIVKESRLAALPGMRQRGHDPGRWRYLLPYMPHFFSHLELDPYDLVISSSHANAVNVRPRRDALHVCYCYTPMRYAWMPAVESERTTGIKRLALAGTRGYLRRIDLAASRRPAQYIAISQAVRDRIRRFYQRDAAVIHPPVDLHDLDPALEKQEGHFLWVHRLVAYKRPELVVEAFRGLPFRLTMVGVGPLEERIRASLPPNVELRGWVSRSELTRLYGTSSGFIHVGEEDFGITMVESLGAGTPVIALARGGARDIVRDETDGLLVEEPDVGSLRSAVYRMQAESWDSVRLALRAREFSRERFLRQLADLIEDAIGKRPAD
jgi:glycosyltransferase involved in cell wall biosynthesis